MLDFYLGSLKVRDFTSALLLQVTTVASHNIKPWGKKH